MIIGGRELYEEEVVERHHNSRETVSRLEKIGKKQGESTVFRIE
jgi:hypothetical protein